MGIFGKKNPPLQRNDQQLMYDNGSSDKVVIVGDKSSDGKNYEPPPAVATNILAADSDTKENIITNPQMAGKPSIENLSPECGSNTDDEDYDNDTGITTINASTNERENNGCCATIEVFEVEYDKERFRNINMKRKVLSSVSKRVTSFSHRVRSFRDDRRTYRHASRKDGEGDGDGTLSSSGSSTSYTYYTDDNDDDTDGDDRFFGVYQHFNAWTRKLPGRSGKHARAMEAILATNPCNEYARRQVEVWKAAAIEGPRLIKVTIFVVTLILMLNAVGMTIFANSHNFWTPGGVVACCHLVVASLVILLLESRPSLTGKGILRDMVTCDCSGKTVEDDMNDYRVNILPMDAYQQYGDHHSDSYGAKIRDDVVQKIGLFRYLYGRGFLCVFTGSMAFATIPGYLNSYPAAFFAVCIPGIALMIVGAASILVGVHATFRWTLLETSIVGDDDHLHDKFCSAGRSIFDKSESSLKSDEIIRLDRKGFLILATTLGLDLDETTLIPAVFALEIKPKDPNAMTFEEFRKWWRGKDTRRHSSPRRSPRSLVGGSGKGSLASSTGHGALA